MRKSRIKIGKGRPTKFKKEYCEGLIKHMSGGLSFDTYAAVIEVNPDTLYEWLKKHKNFSEAKKLASIKRNLFVENAYRAMAIGLPLEFNGKVCKPNTVGMIYWTKNTLGWSDKVETIERQDGFDFVSDSDGDDQV